MENEVRHLFYHTYSGCGSFKGTQVLTNSHFGVVGSEYCHICMTRYEFDGVSSC